MLSKSVMIEIYVPVILSLVLYLYEILSPTLNEEHRLRMLGNRVLRRMFGTKR
jgi:hypothetical protein